ncbi:MAG: protein kinase [Gammaproteobacteria bacterium]|nr:protein kinase [Gammaproteobacteria bacterium]
MLRALAGLGDSSALPQVRKRLADEDRQVALEALRTLESLTDPASMQEVVASIESAMEGASDDFRDQARGVLTNIRARCSATEMDSGSADAPTAAASTMIARPGEPPQRLQPGTRLDLAALTPGTVLDNRYRFVERVGHGAFGTVMRFEDTTVGEEIILKFLNETVSDNELIAKRFVKELRYARRVTHPNVIRIYDFLRIGGLYAISMEYFPGFPLTRELLKDMPMRTDRALRLLREITFGMHAAHRSGVVHRDLKPANILMSHVDQVKVVDFGIAAAAFRDASQETELTQTGAFVGTPAFTSPEQVRGETVDARTDIYSLGIVMYRMFGGRLPYQEKDRRSLLLRHLEGRPRPLGELNPGLPAGPRGNASCGRWRSSPVSATPP